MESKLRKYFKIIENIFGNYIIIRDSVQEYKDERLIYPSLFEKYSEK